MNTFNDEDIINKYIDDELTEEELAAFEKRRADEPVFDAMVKDYLETVIEKTAWYIKQKEQEAFLADYEKFLAGQKEIKIPEPINEEAEHKTPVVPISIRSRFNYWVAAAITLVMSISSYLIPQFTKLQVVSQMSEKFVNNNYILKTEHNKMIDTGYVKNSEIAKKFKETQEFKDNYFEKNSVEDRYVLRSICDNLKEKLEFTQRMVFTEFMIKHIFSIVASSKGQDDNFLPFFKFNENNKTKIKLHSSIKLENKESDRHYSVIILNNVDIVYHFNLEYNKPQNLKFDSTGVYLIKIEAFQKNKKEPFDKTVRVFFVE